MRRDFCLALVFLVFVLAGCGSPVVERIGDRAITEEDVSRRVAVNDVYYPDYDGDKRAGALSELERAFTRDRVLKKYGVMVTAARLEDEARRIDSKTLMPEKLAAIKAVFGDDRASYLKVYVLPVLVDRLLYADVFSGERGPQKAVFLKARQALHDVVAHGWGKNRTKDFCLSRTEGLTERSLFGKQAEARRVGVQLDQSSVEAQVRAQTDDAMKVNAAQEYDWIKTHIAAHYKEGAVYPDLVERDDAFFVIAMGRPCDRKALGFRALVFPKVDYATWLEGELKALP